MPWRHDPAESRRASQLVRATRPTERAYLAYRESVDLYVTAHRYHRPMFALGDDMAEALLGFRTSRIFDRDFLVAWVDDSVLSRFKPSTDAVTTTVEPPLGLARFPMVIAPISRRRSRNHKFISILEHEIVHVCQVLRGVWLAERWPRERDALLDEFMLYAQIEYEANLLQLTRWPDAHKPVVELTIEQWSLLRGYTQALEAVLRSAVRGDLDGHLIPSLIDDVGVHGPARLEQIGCSDAAIEWFADRWLGDIWRAILVVEEQGINLRDSVASSLSLAARPTQTRPPATRHALNTGRSATGVSS